MSQNLDIKSIKPRLKVAYLKVGKHGVFIVLLCVLICYLIVAWRISQLAVAEPSPDQIMTAQTAVPKVDKRIIEQIEQLEQNSPAVQSLFNSARSNPFQE